MRLEEMTADEVQDAASRNIPCILPVGVLEWHGHHNPCGVDLLCSRGVSELVADRIEAVVAPALSYGPGVDAVGSPKHGSLEVGVPVYLPHAAAVVADLVNLGFKHIFCVCHHQGSHGEQGASMRMIAQHYGLNYPSRGERHWWGMLPPDEMVDTGKAPAGRVRRDELPSTTITVLATTEGRSLDPSMCGLVEFAGGPVDHGGFWETSSVQALYPDAVDLSILDTRTDTAWFALPETTGHVHGARGATAGFSARLVDSFAATLAEEVMLVSSGCESPDALPLDRRAPALFRGCAEPPPSALRVAAPEALRLDEMRPLDIQACAIRGVPVLLPVGGIMLSEVGSSVAGDPTAPCGADLLAVRALCEGAAHKHKGDVVVAPPLSYGPVNLDLNLNVDLGGAEEEGPFVPMVRVVLRGLINMGFQQIIVVVSARDTIGVTGLGLEGATAARISVVRGTDTGELDQLLLAPTGASEHANL